MAPKKPKEPAERKLALNLAAPVTGNGIKKTKKPVKKPAFPRKKLLDNGLLDLNAPATYQRTKLAEHNRLVSPLLRLPAELRNKIFGYALGGHYIYIIHLYGNMQYVQTLCGRRKMYKFQGLSCHKTEYAGSKHAYRVLGNNERAMTPFKTVSRVCRQIYHETALLPYALNVFDFANETVLRKWTQCRLDVQLAAVREVAVLSDHIHDWYPWHTLGFDRNERLWRHVEILYVDLEKLLRWRIGNHQSLSKWINRETAEFKKYGESFRNGKIMQIKVIIHEDGLKYARESGFVIDL